ncbi:MAG: lipoprotein [Alphaproteobacteria bacterium]|nr:lipoprotein [Alphaproteobacteria bacterium]
MNRREVLLGLLAAALAACGRKGDPKSPSADEDER